MMSGAFFVGKKELLDWINGTFKLGYSKVEQCASGALHCQILDAIFPEKVPLHKVNFNAKNDYEYVNNFKVLQRVFDEQGIKQHVPVDILVKGKYMDNLEFLQWMKHFWDTKYGGQPYDAEARRKDAISKYGKQFKGGAGESKLAAPSSMPAVRKPAPSPAKPVAAAAPAAAKPKPVSAAPAGGAAAPKATAKPAAAPAASSGGSEEQANKIKELNERVSKLKLTIEGLEKERNFYFGKLREVEVLCQTDEAQDAATKAKVLEILYATDEEFEQPKADGDDAAPAEEPAEEEEAPAEEPAEETF